MPRPSRISGCSACSIVALFGAAAVTTHATAQEVAIPEYTPKGAQWRTGLAAQDGIVWDNDFARWVALGEQKAHQTVAGEWKFLVRGTFTQCYSGGFVHELKLATTAVPPITDYSANSSCRYFQTASASESDANPANWFSWYALAWQHRAKAGATEAPVWTFETITQKAYNALRTGIVGVPANPRIAYEHPQYQSNVAADDLKTGDLRLAILFAGEPERRHINNMDRIREALKTEYTMADENIWILCGDYGAGDDVPDVAWESNAKATSAELEKALRDANGFVVSRIGNYAAGQPLGADKRVKLFIWTTDHGTADAPILMSASNDSWGVFGSDVAAEASPMQHMFEGGNATNSIVWSTAALDIDAFSTGNDEIYVVIPTTLKMITAKPGLYFSVDRLSLGLVGSDVDRANAAMREPAAGVFAATVNLDNREFVRGGAVGLLDDIGGELPTDDLTALSMTSPPPFGDYRAGAWPLQPIFHSRTNSNAIWVEDPWHPLDPGRTYAYWTPVDGWSPGDNLPERFDGLSMRVNMAQNQRVPWLPGQPGFDPGSPETWGNLKFKPGADAFVFSVPRGDPFRLGIGCSVYRWNGALMEEIYTCAQLGLQAIDEVDALHAYVTKPFQNAPPWGAPCAADLSGNGVVEGTDLAMVLGQWMSTDPFADLNGDGITDANDLAVVLGSWGPCP